MCKVKVCLAAGVVGVVAILALVLIILNPLGGSTEIITTVQPVQPFQGQDSEATLDRQGQATQGQGHGTQVK